MKLRVTILGSGTAVPWRGRNSPGLVIQVETEERECLALVDPSAGSVHRMVACGYALESLTHVLITHFHPDHTGDLAPLLFALRNPRLREVGERNPLRWIGPRGLRKLYRSLEGVYGSWIDLGARLEIDEVDPEENQGFFSLGPLEVTCFRVDHTDNSIAYRFESRAGRILAYSGDTDHCDGVVEAARGADLLILECAFPEGKKRPGHLVPSEAGQIATAANARRVLLTHFYPECWGEDLVRPCREHYTGEVLLAEDGLTVNL